MKYEIRNSYVTTHFSGEDESKLILSFLKSSSGRPTMSDIGDLEHSAPGDRGDFEKSRAPPGDRGDLALGDLWAGTALGWPGIGFPSPTTTSSCDCCQQAWKDPSQISAILAEETHLEVISIRLLRACAAFSCRILLITPNLT